MPQRLPDNGIFNYCNIKPGAITSAWHADLDIQLSIQVEGCLRRIQGNEDAFQPTLIILSRADNFHKTQNRTVTVSFPWFLAELLLAQVCWTLEPWEPIHSSFHQCEKTIPFNGYETSTCEKMFVVRAGS